MVIHLSAIIDCYLSRFISEFIFFYSSISVFHLCLFIDLSIYDYICLCLYAALYLFDFNFCLSIHISICTLLLSVPFLVFIDLYLLPSRVRIIAIILSILFIINPLTDPSLAYQSHTQSIDNTSLTYYM